MDFPAAKSVIYLYLVFLICCCMLICFFVFVFFESLNVKLGSKMRNMRFNFSGA